MAYEKEAATADNIIQRYAGDSDAAKVFKGASSGALSGLSLGAALGSWFPGLGTAVGGAIGAVCGAIAGAIVELLNLGPTPEQKEMAAVYDRLVRQLRQIIYAIPSHDARQWIAAAIRSQLKNFAPGNVPFCVPMDPPPGSDFGCALIDIPGMARVLEHMDALVQDELAKYVQAHKAVPRKRMYIPIARMSLGASSGGRLAVDKRAFTKLAPYGVASFALAPDSAPGPSWRGDTNHGAPLLSPWPWGLDQDRFALPRPAGAPAGRAEKLALPTRPATSGGQGQLTSALVPIGLGALLLFLL